MTEFNTKAEGEMGSSTEESFAWTEPEQPTSSTGQQAREWLSQLQAMIENLATQAAPVVREVGIKAAELAAKAGEKAGPVAQRAADLTGQAGHKLAEKASDFATELRRDAAAAKAASATTVESETDAPADAATADEPMTSGVA
ncbi:MAG: hypothetical protein HYX55_11550 [Chloroflexi bacterium]|nr:hypothetical protein [Chloroflexota bacterium]